MPEPLTAVKLDALEHYYKERMAHPEDFGVHAEFTRRAQLAMPALLAVAREVAEYRDDVLGLIDERDELRAALLRIVKDVKCDPCAGDPEAVHTDHAPCGICMEHLGHANAEPGDLCVYQQAQRALGVTP